MVSVEIANLIRASLGDENKNLIPADALIYLGLNQIQRKWMLEYHVKKTSKDYTMTSATVYDMDAGIAKLLKVECSASEDFEYSYDNNSHKLTVVNGLLAGSTFKVWYYVKPVTTITASVNPELPDDYKELLVEAYLTRFRDKYPTFRKIEDIEKDVEQLAIMLRAKDRYQPVMLGEIDF